MSTTKRFYIPAHFDADEVQQSIEGLFQTLSEWPDSVFVIGAIEIGADDAVRSSMHALGFEPLHWVVLADTALRRAAELYAAAGYKEELAKIDAALASLDLAAEPLAKPSGTVRVGNG